MGPRNLRQRGEVPGMDAWAGAGDLLGESRGEEAIDHAEDVPDIPGDETDQGEEVLEGAGDQAGGEEISDGEAEDMAPTEEDIARSRAAHTS